MGGDGGGVLCEIQIRERFGLEPGSSNEFLTIGGYLRAVQETQQNTETNLYL